MKTVLIDTNIVLDIALKRKLFVEKASELLKILEHKKISTCVSATSVTDIYYILRKSKSHKEVIDFLKNFFNYINIAGVDKIIVINALNSNIKDFEDAIQIETAKEQNIQIVITRNEKDFRNSDLEIYNPTEYINLIMRQ